MKLLESCPKILFYLLVASLFLLMASVVAAGVSGLLCLVGDFAAGKTFGWIAGGLGLLFFVHFFWLVFLHVGFTLLKEEDK